MGFSDKTDAGNSHRDLAYYSKFREKETKTKRSSKLVEKGNKRGICRNRDRRRTRGR